MCPRAADSHLSQALYLKYRERTFRYPFVVNKRLPKPWRTWTINHMVHCRNKVKSHLVVPGYGKGGSGPVAALRRGSAACTVWMDPAPARLPGCIRRAHSLPSHLGASPLCK